MGSELYVLTAGLQAPCHHVRGFYSDGTGRLMREKALTMVAFNIYKQFELQVYVLSKKHYFIFLSISVFCLIGIYNEINSMEK